MADKKITQLATLLGSNAVAADELVIVDVTDATMSASGTNKKITLSQFQAAPLSAGTVNGVPYLNGSKVLTTGSALTFDGANLGIGTSSPDGRLTVSQPIDGNVVTFYGSSSNLVYQNFGGTAYLWNIGAPLLFGNISAQPLLFGTSGLERMRIDSSGNLIQSAPTTPPSLATNGQMVFNLTSDTNLRVSVCGSDGVTRTANITLA